MHGRSSWAIAVLAVAIPVCAPTRDATAPISTATIQRWHEDKAAAGPTFAGSPAWREHIELIEGELRKRGVLDLERQTFSYTRWFTSDQSAAGRWSLTVDAQEIPVASYWAYSGATHAQGVTAPLMMYDKKATPEDMARRIVVFDVPSIPSSMAKAFKPTSVHATNSNLNSDIASEHWFQGNYPTRFGRFDKVLRDSGVAGALVVFDLPFSRTDGLYTFPLLNDGIIGVPGLYLDKDAGQLVNAAAVEGESATLRLVANTETAETWFLSGVIPGKRYGTDADEFVLLTTHSDGPNLTQENGTFAMIALAERFAGRVLERSLLIVLDPQHYMPGRHNQDWFAAHPKLDKRIVASIGIEQLGQLEYGERDGEYGVLNQPEPTLLFSQDNAHLIEAAIAAIERHALPRTELRVPSRGKQGVWQGLGDIAVKRNWPGYGVNTGMSGYWSTQPGIESFDASLFMLQLAAIGDLIETLANEPLASLAVDAVNPDSNPALAPGIAR